MPLYHGTGFTTAVSCLTGGVTTCIGKKFSTSKFWTDVRDSDSTAIVYVGETARYLLAAPESELDRKHRVKVMFGNGMRPDVWHRFVERFGIETVGEFFNSTEGVLGLLNISRGKFSISSSCPSVPLSLLLHYDRCIERVRRNMSTHVNLNFSTSTS